MVIGDLMSETDERVTKLFTKKSHHCNTSVKYLVQNLFSKGKESRTISINVQYMVLFKNPRDNTQVVNLAKQMYPGRVKYMQDAFRDATSVPHGYLFVNSPHRNICAFGVISYLTRRRTSMLTFPPPLPPPHLHPLIYPLYTTLNQ